jgi:hypothetical protein
VVLNDPASGSYNNANAGTGKTVLVSGLAISGASSGNYTLAAVSISGAVGAITPAMLTVMADDATKQQGRSNPAFTVTVSGLMGGDTAAVLSGLTVSTTAADSSLLGTYPITSAGGTAVNYVITVRQDGTLTITAAPANGDVPGYNNALSASNTNYNSNNTNMNTGNGTITLNISGNDNISGTTGATGTLICSVSNDSADAQVCSASN